MQVTRSDGALYKKRRTANALGLTLSMAAMAVGLVVLLWILFVLLSKGLAAVDLNMFTRDTPAPGSEGGGLRNAIVGSLMMLGLIVVLGFMAFAIKNDLTCT